jgi:hypothetical protein
MRGVASNFLQIIAFIIGIYAALFIVAYSWQLAPHVLAYFADMLHTVRLAK